MSTTKPSLPAVSPPPSKRDGPEYYDTTKIPAVKVPTNTMEAVLYELRAVRGDLAIIREEAQVTNQRLGLVERRLDEVERRAETGSVRAKSMTEDNAKQDAAIAQLSADLAVVKQDVHEMKESQGAQLAILERLDKVAANPLVRRIAYGIGTLVLAWLATRGYLR
jgi:hypothetical protein